MTALRVDTLVKILRLRDEVDERAGKKIERAGKKIMKAGKQIAKAGK